MRTSMKIFAFACVIASIQCSNFLGSYDKLQTTLTHIDNTEFGKNLLDTIALQMDSNAPMSDISNLIRDMMNDLTQQGAVADENFAAKQDECTTALHGYSARMSHATNEIAESTGAIGQHRQQRTDLKKDIENGEDMLVLNQQMTDDAIEADVQNKLNFAARHEETKQVLEALEVIVPKIQAVNPHTASEVFMELAKIGDSNPISALVQVASSLNPDALAKCVDSLVKLMNDFQEFLDNDVQFQIDEEFAHDNLLVDLRLQREACQAKLADDRQSLVNCEAALQQQVTRLANNEEELESATAGKLLKTGECNSYYASYERDSASRQQEHGILEQVASIVAARLGGLDNFMGSR